MKSAPKKSKSRRKKKIVPDSKLKKVSIVFVSVVLFFVFIGLMGTLLYQGISYLITEGGEYADGLIREEQENHLAKTEEVLLGTKINVESINKYIKNLDENKRLTLEEKKELNMELKKLEKNSINLERNFDRYSSDWSVEFYPKKSEEITSFIHKTRNFSISIDQFVRMFEMGIFSASWYREDQIMLIKENYYELLWFLRQFGFEELNQETE